MRVLFICQLNSVRSPMAEGLLRKRLGDAVDVQSCGLTPIEPNDFMLSVMREVGIDMGDHEPLALADLQDETFDRIIAFTASAQASAEAAFEDTDMEIELWAVPDPGEGSLDVRAMLDNYRAIRSNIDARLGRAFRKTA
ncbi:arsenate reductase [Litorimonas cladophorae]|uniref:Arsenate reductase n=1 Tax=Litorimonas cladophorae TaxID=1220491 RepID=A0A918NAP0_9PROT|nr:low molecular weight phosphatase family protein [Litorimonas cladophorae]GGX58793.1 arsenate reductase [Litorimonas cladophorae]